MKNRILVIDDEVQIRRLLRLGVEGQGFEVVEAANGTEGLQMLVSQKPDLVLLDLGLPDLNGLEVLRRLREWSQVPVIILSVQEDENDKIAALDLGADDYVTKPFGMGELVARVRAALRHRGPSQDVIFKSGGLEVDFVAHVVRLDGVEVHLTVTEYALLKLFVRHAGKVLTHRQILKEVWGPNQDGATHYLRVYIGSLRKKLEAEPANPIFIKTEPGVGYRFKG